MALPAGCHPLVRHDSYLDLSRVVAHSTQEQEDAREFDCLSADICRQIADMIDAGLQMMPQRQAQTVLENIRSICD
ncbi:hypothetical protein [Ensifer canadensis]|uniref:hypothetical protein n=1 Tax=Ensifer canadensis TaxID=555315 RepID=UPI0035E3D375